MYNDNKALNLEWYVPPKRSYCSGCIYSFRVVSPTCSSCASLTWDPLTGIAPWCLNPTPHMCVRSLIWPRFLCSTDPPPRSTDRLSLQKQQGVWFNTWYQKWMQFGLLLYIWPFSQCLPSKPSAHEQNMCSPDVRDGTELPPLRQILPVRHIVITFTTY